MRHLFAFVLAAAGLAATPALAAAVPPANDAYLASAPVDVADYKANVDTTEATTQPDLFNPTRDGAPLGGAGPRAQSFLSSITPTSALDAMLRKAIGVPRRP